MKYVSIDIETTGLNPLRHDIVEIGAVIDDLSDPKPVEELPRFHTYVKPQGYGEGSYFGDPYALSMHPHIFKRIAIEEKGYTYLHPDDVADAFHGFVKDAGLLEAGRINVAGKNYAGFDRPFLEQNILDWKALPIRHRVLDPGSLYWHPGDESVPNLATCLERAGLDPEGVTHNAVDDAIAVVQVLRYGLLGAVS